MEFKKGGKEPIGPVPTGSPKDSDSFREVSKPGPMESKPVKAFSDGLGNPKTTNYDGKCKESPLKLEKVTSIQQSKMIS